MSKSKKDVIATLSVGGKAIAIMEADLTSPSQAYDGKRSSAQMAAYREQFIMTADQRGYESFRIWKVSSLGYVFPTLKIRNPRKGRKEAERTYAVAANGQLVRVGMGPHVLEQYEVFVKKSRREALQPILDLIKEGEIKANECRDELSSRMARGSLRRRAFGGGAWDS